LKYLRLFLLAFALVSLLSSAALASQAHWIDIGRQPVCIGVGTISSVVDSAAAYFMEKEDPDPAGILRIFSSGTLELTEYLWGDHSLQSVPVLWYSACRFEPSDDDLRVSETSQRELEEGEQRIWVIWARIKNEDSPYDGYFYFQGYEMDYYNQMLLDIEKEFGGLE